MNEWTNEWMNSETILSMLLRTPISLALMKTLASLVEALYVAAIWTHSSVATTAFVTTVKLFSPLKSLYSQRTLPTSRSNCKLAGNMIERLKKLKWGTNLEKHNWLWLFELVVFELLKLSRFYGFEKWELLSVQNLQINSQSKRFKHLLFGSYFQRI